MTESRKTRDSKTVLKGLGQCSFTRNGDPAAIDVKDGKILRIRPLHFEDKYTKEEIKPWRIEKDGKVLEPQLKSYLAPYMLAYKKRVYSPNRILYPLIREDWDLRTAGGATRRTGARASTGASPGTRRPTSSPPRSSASARPTGPTPFSATATATARPRWCTVPTPARCSSWRRWAATPRPSATPTAGRAGTGAPSTCGARASRVTAADADNVLNDITQNTQMLIAIGCDLETTPWGFGGQFPSNVCYFWNDIGIKQISIAPDLNYYAGVHADKWIPILPNTDAALHLAIAYTWIKEGTYDKEYVDTHVVGFEPFRAYVMGEEDGVPKTPEWAAEKTGVSEWTIKALARQWAEQVTSTLHYYGGSYIRGPYCHEPARLECLPRGHAGDGQARRARLQQDGRRADPARPAPAGDSCSSWTSSAARCGAAVRCSSSRPQIIPKTQLHQAILDGRR